MVFNSTNIHKPRIANIAVLYCAFLCSIDSTNAGACSIVLTLVYMCADACT